MKLSKLTENINPHQYNVVHRPDGGAQSTNDYSIQPMGMRNAKSQGVINKMPYPNTWDKDEFENLTSFVARKKYADQRLPKLGSGSSRIVYKIDDNKVLKLAKNRKGVAQNEAESDHGYANYQTAEVYDYDPEYKWVEMELTKPISPQRFEQLTGITIEQLNHFLRYEDYRKRSRGSFPVSEPENYEAMWENPFASAIWTLFADYDMPPGDLGKISSYGETGDGDVVLIDVGLSREVGKNQYGFNMMKNEEYSKDEFHKITDPEAKRRYANKTLELIKLGKHRITYRVDPNTIMIMSKTDKGRHHNRIHYNMKSKGYPVADIRTMDPKFDWIEVELTTPINKYKFEEKLGISLGDFRAYLLSKLFSEPERENHEEVENNTWAQEMYELMRIYNIPLEKFMVITNYGIDRLGNVVLINYGLNDEISSDLYGVKNVKKMNKKMNKLNAMISTHTPDMNSGGRNFASEYWGSNPVNSFQGGLVW